MFEAYKEQEDDQGDAKKDGEGEEDEDFDENEFDLTDGEYQAAMNADGGGGKWFRRVKFAFRYSIRCRCFKRASFTNLLTVVFNVMMMVNALVKEGTVQILDDIFLNTDLTEDF